MEAFLAEDWNDSKRIQKIRKKNNYMLLTGYYSMQIFMLIVNIVLVFDK